jgi:hypothetical protein
MWCRVFGVSPAEPSPAGLLEHLQGLGLAATGQFAGDGQGWFRAEIQGDGAAPPFILERYLVSEEGIRAELNNWAAWIETTGDGAPQNRLMQHLISTTQLFTLTQPNGAVGALAAAVCRWLARETGGVYQMDEQGFFDAAGGSLLKE